MQYTILIDKINIFLLQYAYLGKIKTAKAVSDFKTNYGFDIDLLEAYNVNVKVKYSGDKSSIESNIKHTVFKYNGQWYSI